MSKLSDDGNDHRVGYKRPPVHTRWKKGQSGRSRKKSSKPPETEADIIERLLLKRRQFEGQDDETRIMTVVEGIAHVLAGQVMKGNASAYRVLQKYRAYQWHTSHRVIDVEFADH